ncbi:MAG: hypothetical protein ACOYLI_08360 [Synechococcus lacustris]|jgi:hypothetical protein
MTLLLDTSLWIDFTRARSPAHLKQFIAPFVLDPKAHLAEPVRFDADFEAIASVSELRLQRLERPA